VIKPLLELDNALIRRHLSIHIKESVFSSIYKEETNRNTNNYCPVTGKSNSKLANFLSRQTQYMINKSQFGFRKNKSTNDAVVTIIENAYN
jgi:hypothetical protein